MYDQAAIRLLLLDTIQGGGFRKTVMWLRKHGSRSLMNKKTSYPHFLLAPATAVARLPAGRAVYSSHDRNRDPAHANRHTVRAAHGRPRHPATRPVTHDCAATHGRAAHHHPCHAANGHAAPAATLHPRRAARANFFRRGDRPAIPHGGKQRLHPLLPLPIPAAT